MINFFERKSIEKEKAEIKKAASPTFSNAHIR